MFLKSSRRTMIISAAIVLWSPFAITVAEAQSLRIATYNILGDGNSDGSGSVGAGMETVLQGLGDVHLNDNGTPHAQPLDILAVQELSLTSPQSELQSIVNSLNAYYGAGTYAFNATTDPTTGGLGGGPSALIYNTHTIQVVSATVLGSASGSGAPRAPMQYLLHPVGYSSAADFYVDVSHTKSGTTSSDAHRRNIEATTITSNASLLGASAHVISLGDFNITGGSGEQTYQTMRGFFNDPAHPSGSWSDSTAAGQQAIAGLLSESATGVSYRDDIQFVSPAAAHASGSAGIQYDAGSMLVFGNGGSSSLVGQAVTSSVNSAALADLSAAERSAILSALTTASDHLPVVADYDIVGFSPLTVPEPTTAALLAIPLTVLARRRRRCAR